MDVYHKVLAKIYEMTGGKETEAVDLKELVKKEGFLGNYPQIKEHLSSQSWIIETSRRDSVKITHWGVSEAKKSQTAGGNNSQNLKKEVTRVISETRELMVFLEELSNETTSENIARAEKKIGEINSAIQKLKSSV